GMQVAAHRRDLLRIGKDGLDQLHAGPPGGRLERGSVRRGRRISCDSRPMNATAAPATAPRVVRGACPHDCPDTCALRT
ncbi:MAG TPA: hypothetical protein PLF63_15530, partial [Rubrivivax sp.]|nr:hypothetical protein [Rubrivivax sp.]